ncbi:hypothetical protein EYC84_004754 [Monilinia fructicola]|uniref:Uncharacterized protein n=1 Tax=Monilinia fructicola TaxID=38448 RepID=A0A5M9K3X5_MONFR|nr:hypothetical protein EYC84_004754 [Monilinia fructicola]
MKRKTHPPRQTCALHPRIHLVNSNGANRPPSLTSDRRPQKPISMVALPISRYLLETSTHVISIVTGSANRNAHVALYCGRVASTVGIDEIDDFCGRRVRVDPTTASLL